jgi:curved DNA-binding protein CbpA
MSSHSSYYDVLEISSVASDEDVRRAYRRLALRWHPDKNAGDPSAAEKFKEINHAYEVLSDPNKRKEYDQYGMEGKERTTNGGRTAYEKNAFPDFQFQFHDPSEIFQQFFGTSSSFTPPLFNAPPFFGDGFDSPFQSRQRRHSSFSFMPPMFTNHSFFASALDARPGPFPNLFNEDPFFESRGMTDRSHFNRSMGSQSMGGSMFGGVTESRSTRVMNGRTETIVSKVDAQGNSTVIETSSDGRRKVIVNGIITEHVEPAPNAPRVTLPQRGPRTRAVTEASRPSYNHAQAADYRNNGRSSQARTDSPYFHIRVEDGPTDRSWLRRN